MSHPALNDCQTCKFYRPQASFVDAYKDFDRNPPREPVMKSLLELRKDETHAQENEMELQLELMMTEQKTWPEPPRFAPLCVFAEGLFLPAAKNPDGRCNDYQPSVNRQGRACRTCKFLVRPETKIGDRRELPTGAGGSQETAFYRELNKEYDNADAMAQALEIEQSFVADGRLPSAQFLPTCAIKVDGGRKCIPPFCNLRSDCKDHQPHIALPDALLEWVETTADEDKEIAARALNHTRHIAQLVAKWGIAHPAEHMAELAAWVQKEPASRWGVALWATSDLYPRWVSEAPNGGSAVKVPVYQPGDPLPSEWGLPPATTSTSLLPFVAGCDAYEWGLLAAYSKNSEEAAKNAAAVICQQLAEFLVSAVSPFEGSACIDATIELVGTEGLFAHTTIDLVRGFLLRLRGHGDNLRLAARTDLQQYFEELAALLSYKVGAWGALQWRETAYLLRFDAADPGLGKRLRELDRSKITEARAEGNLLLKDIGALAAGTITTKSRILALNNLLVSNDRTVDRDQADSINLSKDACDALAKRTGLDMLMDEAMGARESNTYRTALENSIRQALGTIYDIPRTQDNLRRKVMGSLLFLRGAQTVTKTALEVLERKPQGGRVPESIEQALSDPLVPTLEAFHARQFAFTQPASEDYLMRGRRIGTPHYARKE